MKLAGRIAQLVSSPFSDLLFSTSAVLSNDFVGGAGVCKKSIIFDLEVFRGLLGVGRKGRRKKAHRSVFLSAGCCFELN